MRHAVCLTQNYPQEIFFGIGGEFPGIIHQSLGIRADIGQRGAQLMRYVGHKFPAHLLCFALLGDVVNDDHNAALPLPVKGRQQQFQTAPVYLAVSIQIARLLFHG